MNEALGKIRPLATAVAISASLLGVGTEAKASGDLRFIKNERYYEIIDKLDKNPGIAGHTEVINVTDRNISELENAFPHLKGIKAGDMVGIKFSVEHTSGKVNSEATIMETK